MTSNAIFMLKCADTELPKRELLEQKLHKAVEFAGKQLEVKTGSQTLVGPN